MQDKRNKNYTDKIKNSGKKWDYIPCPICIKNGHVVEVKSCPNGITCFPEDGKLLALVHQDVFAQELIDQITVASQAFQSIKDGQVPPRGAVAFLLDRSLKSITKLINQAK